jgi:hypothetical protein
MREQSYKQGAKALTLASNISCPALIASLNTGCNIEDS